MIFACFWDRARNMHNALYLNSNFEFIVTNFKQCYDFQTSIFLKIKLFQAIFPTIANARFCIQYTERCRLLCLMSLLDFNHMLPTFNDILS